MPRIDSSADTKRTDTDVCRNRDSPGFRPRTIWTRAACSRLRASRASMGTRDCRTGPRRIPAPTGTPSSAIWISPSIPAIHQPVDMSRGKEWPEWFPGAGFDYVSNIFDLAFARGAANELAVIWEGDGGDTRSLTYQAALGRNLPLRQRACRARHRKRRPNRNLPADDPGNRGRGARLRLDRRDLHPDVLRLWRRSGRVPLARLRREAADHRRRLPSPRQVRSTEADRR